MDIDREGEREREIYIVKSNKPIGTCHRNADDIDGLYFSCSRHTKNVHKHAVQGSVNRELESSTHFGIYLLEGICNDGGMAIDD